MGSGLKRVRGGKEVRTLRRLLVVQVKREGGLVSGGRSRGGAKSPGLGINSETKPKFSMMNWKRERE